MSAHEAGVPAASASPDPGSPLDRGPAGRPMLVVAVDEALAPDLAREGIYPGAILRVVVRAPLGGPIILATGGARVAVPRDLARAVVVRLAPAAAEART